jgi:hypothetical protein
MSKLLKAAAAATATATTDDSATGDILSQTPRQVDLFDLTLITNSADTQHRVGLNMAKVAEYAADMRESIDGFPAVWLVEDAAESRYWIARGHHRIAAAKQAGLAAFPARVYTGTQRDAILLGAGSNAEHGYKRSRDDLQHELDMFLLDDEWVKWSDGYIAKLVKCARKTVTNRREELVRQGLISESGERIYKDKHGHINVMQTGGIQTANTTRARVPLTDLEIEAVILTELGRRVTSGRLADKIDWLRKHRTFAPHYTAIIADSRISTDPEFAAIADRLIDSLEAELKELHARNEHAVQRATLQDLVAIVQAVVAAKPVSASILRAATDPKQQKSTTYYEILNAVRTKYRHHFDLSEMLQAIAIVADGMVDSTQGANDGSMTHESLAKLGRFVPPNPPATEQAGEQTTQAGAPAFNATLFWSHMTHLSDHLDKAAPLLREMLAHLPADLKASANDDDVDRLIDLATVARLCAERAKQGKIA